MSKKINRMLFSSKPESEPKPPSFFVKAFRSQGIPVKLLITKTIAALGKMAHGKTSFSHFESFSTSISFYQNY